MTSLARTLILAAAVLLLPISAAHAKMGPPIAQSILRLETHSDSGNPDDYLTHTFTYSRQLEGRVIGNVYYTYKQNLDEHNVGGNSLGVNVTKVFSDEAMFTLGYAFTDYEQTTRRRYDYDRDRLLLALHYIPWRTDHNAKILLGLVFSTQTDWVNSKSLDVGLSYKTPLSKYWKMDLGYKYTHGYGTASGHLLNQYNIDFSFNTSKKTAIDVGYLFVDKVYSATPAVGTSDDDSIVRAGVRYTYQ